MLYQIQLTGQHVDDLRDGFWNREKADPKTRSFSEALVEGVLENIAELDLEIGAYAKNWSVERMAIVDRIVLQIGLYELIHHQDVPWKVVADEVVTLARLFSSEQSTSFINGIIHAWGTNNRLEVTP